MKRRPRKGRCFTGSLRRAAKCVGRAGNQQGRKKIASSHRIEKERPQYTTKNWSAVLPGIASLQRTRAQPSRRGSAQPAERRKLLKLRPAPTAALRLLERELQRKLQNARRRCVEYLPERLVCLIPVQPGISVCGVELEIDVVEDVERLGPELEVITLAEFRILHQCHVVVEQPGSAKRVLSLVAERPDGIGLKQRRVDPLLLHLAVRFARSHDRLMYIRACEIRSIFKLAGQRVVHTAVNREGEASLPRHDAAHLPPVHQLARGSLQPEMRKLISARQLENMPHIIVRRPVIEMPVKRIRWPVVRTNRRKIVHVSCPRVVGQQA